MNFYADAGQDQFVARMLQFKRNGYCVDIGSCHSIISNNTFAFQELDWASITVEINSEYNDSYRSRKNSKHYNENALKIDYQKIFEENNFPETIDYLSLDIDTLSLDVLKILPLNKYKFRIITIEHDAYLYGDEYRLKQREILKNNNYILACPNILVPNPGHIGYDGVSLCPFEDWWVYQNEFDSNLLEKINIDLSYPKNIINNI